MDVHTDIQLKNYTTIKLGGPARFFADIHSKDELQSVYKNAKDRSLSIFVLGGGSNIVVQDQGFPGLVLRMCIPGFKTTHDDEVSTTIEVGAGENWDSVVKRTVDMNLSGIEAMSAIPGTTGAAPVQNIGAYGQEISDCLQSVEVFDTTNDSFVVLSNEQCDFSYRHSIFRDQEKGRYIICSVTLKLSKNLPTPPFYESVQKYFDERNITHFSPRLIRDAVMAIRFDKLPDPSDKPNAGSFFKNTIVESWQLDHLLESHPDMPHFDMGEGKHKIPTGWLIEQTGLKGQLLHGIRIHEKNCLVLINESARNYDDLSSARQEIVQKVHDMFNLMIEQEPLEV
jgi:UDP-N-acetylmuramate dehydrogenase